MKKKQHYVAVKSAVNTLSALTCMNPEKVIDILTGWAWDEEEASELKNSDAEFDVMKHVVSSNE